MEHDRVNVTRMGVVWCPDWPVVAWGVPLDEPAAVFVANRVVACSPAARHEGVVVGQRRRDAQGRCPDLAVLERDTDREGRLFEPVAAALETLTPRIEVAGPGLVGFPTRGPSRFFGGDQSLAERMVHEVQPVLAGRGEARVALADGVFAARLAARTSEAAVGPVVLPPSASADFLRQLPISTLEQPELTDVLVRLGLTTLGLFAALSAADVSGRFGREGLLAHRLAHGYDEHPPDLRRPAPDLAVTWQFEPPAERIETCAYAAKALGDELHAALDADGLACTRVAIEVETESGEQHVRLWRHEGALSAAALAERARWQLDGWLHLARTSSSTESSSIESARTESARPAKPGSSPKPASGVVRLSLIPDEVVAATGRQLGFWGGRAARADDVTRTVARLQGLLGPEAVLVPEWRGGRSPGEQIALIPAAAVDLGEERVATKPEWITEPWPGQIPDPAPARVLSDPPMVEVADPVGRPVAVSGRGEVSAEPALVTLDQKRPRRVQAWAGPWLADERWWDPLTQRRRARLQVVLDDGSAHLLMIEQQTWYLEASYC
jgi:protein ImuB